MIKEIFPKLEIISDKEVLQWILLAFLMDSLEFIGKEENRKTKRIEWVRKWIETNAPDFWGEYKDDKTIDFNKAVKEWEKLES